MSTKDLTILGCSSQQPTRKRNHGAYLVRWNGEGFLFDPGEGTQRQFIFANIAPTCVTRIFISHFHGDHCLGLGSMLMRLNLDKIKHPIHCYYPAEKEVYFKRLQYGTIYRENIHVVEHPIEKPGIIENTEHFQIEAYPLVHGTTNYAFRIIEKDILKFEKDKLSAKKIHGPLVRRLQYEGKIFLDNQWVHLEEVSFIKKGDIFAIALDTLPCQGVIDAAKNATLFLCESTYLEEHKHLAKEYLHLTAKQAAHLAKQAGVNQLVLTHFSARYSDLEGFSKEALLIFPNTLVGEDLNVFTFPK